MVIEPILVATLPAAGTHKETGHVEVVACHVHEDPTAVLQVSHRRRRWVSASDVDGAYVTDGTGVDLRRKKRQADQMMMRRPRAVLAMVACANQNACPAIINSISILTYANFEAFVKSDRVCPMVHN